MSTIKVSAIIPCLNEEETLGICIEKAQQSFRDLGIAGEVVVGDNGSTDKSVAIAESLGARVAHQPVKGYGAALMAAANAAEGEWLIMADADDSYDWSNLGPFIEKLEAGYDLGMGNRFKGGIHPGAMPPLHRYLGNPVLSFIARLLYKVPIGDFHCGMRGFTKDAWRRMALETTGMEFATEMVVRADQAKLKIAEVPTELRPDKRTKPPHLRSFRDGWRHLRFIMTYAPNWLYLVPGLSLLLCGLLLQLLLLNGPAHLFGLYLGPHFLALGLLMSVSGLSITLMGIMVRVYLVNLSRLATDRLVDWINRAFSLEVSLLFGAVLLLVGLGVDLHLLVRWLSSSAPMEASVHTAFIASGLIFAGLQVIFSAFFIRLLRHPPGA